MELGGLRDQEPYKGENRIRGNVPLTVVFSICSEFKNVLVEDWTSGFTRSLFL